MIFKNIVLLSVILTTVTSLTIGTSYAVEEIDQSFTGPFTTELLINPDTKAQTFVPTVNNLSAVELYINDRYGRSDLVTITATIYDVRLGTVVGQESTTADIPTVIGLVKPIIPTRIEFSPPLSLNKGDSYSIGVTVTGELDGPAIAWRGSSVDSYPKGTAVPDRLGVSDFGFTTYYNIPPPPPVIPDSATVGEGVTIGAGTILGEDVVVNKDSEIGENVIVGENTEINKDVVVGDNTIIGEDVIVNKDVTIGNNVTIGDNVTIGKDVVIGDNAVIGDNVIIGKNAVIAPNAIVPDGTVIPNNGTFP